MTVTNDSDMKSDRRVRLRRTPEHQAAPIEAHESNGLRGLSLMSQKVTDK